jgi:hypothetical protein
MTRYREIICLAVLVVAGATAVFADDFAPAPWRGQPLTVAAEWDFSTSNTIDVPPDYLNFVGDGIHPYNDCFGHTHFQNVFWQPNPNDPNDGRAYTTDLPGQLLFFNCNFIDDFQHKYIWAQITYGGAGVPFVYEVVAPNAVTNEWEFPVLGTLVERTLGSGHNVEFWHLPYNPDREYVNIELPPFTWIDQVWIETISTNGSIATEYSTWGEVKSLFR